MKMLPTTLPNSSKWSGPRGLSVNDTAQCPDQRVLVVGVATHFFERRLGDHAVDVKPGGGKAREVLIVLGHQGDELLVARAVEIGGVGQAETSPIASSPKVFT